MKTVIQSWITVLALFFICQSTQAQVMVSGLSSPPKPTHPIATIVSEDVVAISVIDIQQFQVAQLNQATKAITEIGLLPSEALQPIGTLTNAELDHVSKLQEFGVSKIYFLLRTHYTPHDCFVIPLGGDAKEGTAKKIMQHLQQRDLFKQMKYQIEPGVLVISESMPHIDSLLNGPARKDLATVYEALKRVDEKPIALTVIGNADTRRVLRELVPTISGELEELSGKLIADQIDRLTISLSFEPDVNLEIKVETKSPETAATVQRLLPIGIRMLLENEAVKKSLPTNIAEKIQPALQPELKENTVIFSTKSRSDSQ